MIIEPMVCGESTFTVPPGPEPSVANAAAALGTVPVQLPPLDQSVLALPDQTWSAGGVTCAQDVPMRSSSTIIPLGTAVLPMRRRRLAKPERSAPPLVVSSVAGAVPAPKVLELGFTQIDETSLVAPATAASDITTKTVSPLAQALK